MCGSFWRILLRFVFSHQTHRRIRTKEARGLGGSANVLTFEEEKKLRAPLNSRCLLFRLGMLGEGKRMAVKGSSKGNRISPKVSIHDPINASHICTKL